MVLSVGLSWKRGGTQKVKGAVKSDVLYCRQGQTLPILAGVDGETAPSSERDA